VPLSEQLRRFARAEWPMVTVLAVLAAAPIYVAAAPGHWLRGAALVAAALLLAAGFRLVLSDRRAGGLAVRARWWDVVCYAGLGAAILVTGLVLPG
jgi:hypothetical protein